MNERDRWESRYAAAAEPFYGRRPSPFLVRSLPLLPERGLCCDLGSGEGRNAVFLAERGFTVIAADLAVAGLARGRSLGRAVAQRLLPVACDLGASPLRPSPRSVDLLLAVNYHDRLALRDALAWLRPGGAVLVEGFAREQAGRSSGGPREPELLWRPNELLELAAGLRVVWYEDRLIAEDDNPRHRGEKWVVRLIARATPEAE